MEWWQEAAPVTIRGNFLERISVALGKPEEQRDEVDTYIVGVYTALEQKVATMETKREGDE